MMLFNPAPTVRAATLVRQIEAFVHNTVVAYEKDPRLGGHGPSDDLVQELRDKARAAGLMTPHILADGSHLTQRETAAVLRASGHSPLGPVALNTMAPDEGNMFLIGKVANAAQKRQFLEPLVAGRARSAFLMTEPAEDGGAGSDPGMLRTTATPVGGGWTVNGRKAFITGFQGASVGIIMARTENAATMFLVGLPNPAIRIERVLDTIDASMPGGHSVITIDDLHVGPAAVIGEVDQGFQYAQVRLAPARLSHCMRWLGLAARAHEIAAHYARTRTAFGKALIDHEGVGFMLADNLVDLKQSELMIDWTADALDAGEGGAVESSMTKVAVADALFRVADRCVQVMGGTGVTTDTIVEQAFREFRAFRIYDGPTEVHKWSLAKRIKRHTIGLHNLC